MAVTTLTDQELIDIFTKQLPRILEERPELEPQLYHYFLKAFARKEEVAAVAQELSEFREETRENFAKVNARLDQVRTDLSGRIDQVQTDLSSRIDQVQTDLSSRIDQVHKDLSRQIDQLGSRWGIRNESLFRETIISLLEKSFGAKVEQRHLGGEQFDLIISDGEHILLEIAASAERGILTRWERKRRLYVKETGVMPARVIYAVAGINSRLAQSLRDAGIDVVEPEEV